MGALHSMVGHIVLDRMMHGRPPAPQKMERTQMILCSAAAFFVLMASVFGLIAFFHALRQSYAPDVAAAATGLAALILALMIMVYAYAIRDEKKPQMPHKAQEAKTQLDAFLKNLEGDWDKPIREHPKTAIALAALAGYLLGDR